MLLLDIIIGICFIGIVAATFYEQQTVQKEVVEVILSATDEPSALQCAHRCRFVNRMSSVHYNAPRCKCILLKKGGGDGIALDRSPTLSGAFSEKVANTFLLFLIRKQFSCYSQVVIYFEIPSFFLSIINFCLRLKHF